MKKILLFLSLFVAGAASLEACVPTNNCAVTADCLEGEACSDGTCVAASVDAGTDASLDDAGTDAGTCVDGGTRWYPDLDHDGHGDAASAGERACSHAGWVSLHDDCNDTNLDISPDHAEVCGNSTDDDCDDAVDESCGCENPGSMTACCSGRGTQTCGSDGQLTACTASTSVETCNGVDDDCDGQTDEGTNLCGGGQACVSGACACPGGQTLCNGTCATTSTEVCDGVDNDCNGQTDEGLTINCYRDTDGDQYIDSVTVTQQCPVSNACPAGYTALGSAEVDCDVNNPALFRLVSSNTDADDDGACVGSASNDCVGQAPLPGRRFTASCETPSDCDDNDALATVEVPVRDDGDGDGFCVNAPANACGVPAGKRLASQCQPTDDCNDANGQLSGFVSVRADADGDGSCVGATLSACGVPAGYRLASACQTSDDCADNNAQFYKLEPLRDDADNDGYCVNQAVNTCSSPSVLPPGKKRPSQCQATDDCSDNNANAYLVGTWAADGDNDGSCDAIPPAGGCRGATPPSGYRDPASCSSYNDCAPGDASKYRNVSLLTDADNDGWCTGVASTVCIGASAPSGQRIASSCSGSDCRDTNAYANSTCFISEGYTTSSHTQTCPSANTPTLYSVTVQTTCPVGFNTVNYRAVRSSGTGSCTYGSPSQVYQQCNFLDGSSCGVVADCQAL